VAFYLHKNTQSHLGSLIVISGAYGAFKRNLLIRVNGYRKSVGEDMDITLKIQQYIKLKEKRYMLDFIPQSICYTECPETFRNLIKQRIRWQKAFIDCSIKYGPKMFRRFKAGISFFFIFDYLILGTITSFLFFLLPVFLILGASLSWTFIVLFCSDFVISIVECLASKKIAALNDLTFKGADNRLAILFITTEMLLFRLLGVLFVVAGTVSYFVSRERWNKAERLGRSFCNVEEAQILDNRLKEEVKPVYQRPDVIPN
jgi:cellulose synthase/poly-beta-1,6-N-acetylglucosamine synthase-like glycosyltransferase